MEDVIGLKIEEDDSFIFSVNVPSTQRKMVHASNNGTKLSSGRLSITKDTWMDPTTWGSKELGLTNFHGEKSGIKKHLCILWRTTLVYLISSTYHSIV